MVPRWSRSPGILCLCHMEVWEPVGYLSALIVSLARASDTLLLSEVASHHHVRNAVGLFDVGHMVQTKCVGNPSPSLPESLFLPLDSLYPFRQISGPNISHIPRMAHPILPRLALTLLIHPLRATQRKRWHNRRHGHNKTFRRRFLCRHERRET